MQAIGQLAGGVAHDFNNVLDRDHRLFRSSARQSPPDRSVLPGHHADQAERQSGGGAGAAIARLFAPPDACARRRCSSATCCRDCRCCCAGWSARRSSSTCVYGRDLWQVKADLNQFEQVIVNLVVNARDAMPRRRQDHAAHAQLSGRRMRQPERGGCRARPITCWSRSRTRATAFRPRSWGQDLRAVLHHQGGRQGHRPRPVDGLRHRQADGRLCVLATASRAGARRSASSCRAMSRRQRSPRMRSDARPTAAEIEVAARSKPGRGSDRPGRDPAGRGRRGGARFRLARARLARLHGAGGRHRASTRSTSSKRREEPIDLIVSDVIMPEMDGPTMLRELRKRGSGAKVIFVSGYADDAFAQAICRRARTSCSCRSRSRSSSSSRPSRRRSAEIDTL